MIRFGPTLNNPLLQIVVSLSEATIRRACAAVGMCAEAPSTRGGGGGVNEGETRPTGTGEGGVGGVSNGGGGADLEIAVGLGQFPDGRDSIIVVLCGGAAGGRVVGRFEMVLCNYFDHAILLRVARRAWLAAREVELGVIGERRFGVSWN